jgi:CBS domain-containing protein
MAIADYTFGSAMTKVSDVMTPNVPQVDYNDTVLEACKKMSEQKSTGAVVFQGEGAVGILTDRSLLKRFITLDRKPSDMKVSEVMGPILRIDKNVSTKDAAKKLVNSTFSRLCVFEGSKFLGWVTLTDLAREASKDHLLQALLRHNAPEEIYCPACQIGVLQRRTDEEGKTLRWECTNCNHVE